MADSKLITAIGEELECPVCAEYLTDARFLSCMHTFCKGCLEKCDKTFGRGGKASMNCPLCRKVTCLGKNGVAGLQTDFTSNKLVTRLTQGIEERKNAAGNSQNDSVSCQSCQDGVIIAYCLSCCHFICASCQSLHTKLSAMRTHEVVPMKELHKGNVTVVRTQKTKFCSDHKLDIVYFCYTCVRYLCDICYMLHPGGHECSEPMQQDGDGIPESSRKKDAVKIVIAKLEKGICALGKQKTKVKRLRASVKRHFGLTKDQLKSSHDLRLRTVTKVMKEKHDDLVKEMDADEELILATIASVDESLGHAESRALEAKAIGDNAVMDGEHAEIAFVDDYISCIVSSLNDDESADKKLKQIERYAEGVTIKPDTANSDVKCLASLGHVFRPVIWDPVATCKLPSEIANVKSIQFDSATGSFLLSSSSAIHSIDLTHVDGTMKHVGDFPKEHVVQDMVTASDGTSSFVLCQDNCLLVYKNQNWDAVVEKPHSSFESTMSCMAINDKGTIVVGDQSSQTIVGYSSKTFKKMTDISPIQMAFTSSGDLAAVCRRIINVDDVDSGSWNQAGVAVRVFGVGERWENVIDQNNWQAAAVTTKHGSDMDPGRFYGLGIYVMDDGRQLASLAEYDIFGIKRESIFEDMDLPIDLENGMKPLIATDSEGITFAVFTGVEVRLFQKRNFNMA